MFSSIKIKREREEGIVVRKNSGNVLYLSSGSSVTAKADPLTFYPSEPTFSVFQSLPEQRKHTLSSPALL